MNTHPILATLQFTTRHMRNRKRTALSALAVWFFLLSLAATSSTAAGLGGVSVSADSGTPPANAAQDSASAESLQQGLVILSQTNLSGSTGSLKYYTMTIPAGYNVIEITTSISSGSVTVTRDPNGYDTTGVATVHLGAGGSYRWSFVSPGLYYVVVRGDRAYTGFNFTYKAYYSLKAQITSPANGSTLISTTPTFVWNEGAGADSYALWVGTAVGSYNLYAGNEGTNVSRQVTVPAGIGRIHVTLWSLINGSYHANYYVYETTPAIKAVLTSPANGSTLANGALNLSWTTGTGVSRYYVYVGSALGGYDIAAIDAGTATSRSLTVPNRGAPVYVRLYSLINGAFQWNDYWFTTAQPGGGASPARITSHTQGATLGSQTVTFNWDTGVSVSQYALWVGSAPGGYDLYSGNEGTSRSRSVTVPGDGRRLYVALHSLIGGAYQTTSYWFTAPTLPDGGAAQITSPAPGSTLASKSLLLNWSAAAGATNYYLYVGRVPGGNDLYSASEGTSLTRTVQVPDDGRPVYVTLYSLVRGAYIQTSARYTAANTASGSKPALITSPAPTTTLPGTTNTFTWGGGSGVTTYALWIGSTPGGYDLWASSEGLNTSRTVALPGDGRKVYATIYSFIAGAWQGATYVYTAATALPTKAVITSPAASSILPGTAATFTWSGGNGVGTYALWLGRAPGYYDVYAGAEGLNTSRALTTLPLDGSPIYATLWSFINGAWQSSETIYQANVP